MEELNALILKYCLKIVIDKVKNVACAGFSHSFYNERDIIALINTETNVCLSSIMFKIEPPYVSINSQTKDEHKGLKYNILLRAALILYLKDFLPTTENTWYITSLANSPVSLYVSMKYFNFKFWRDKENTDALTSENITFSKAERNIQKWIKCDLSDGVTIDKAYAKFTEIATSGLLSICHDGTGIKRKGKGKTQGKRKRKGKGKPYGKMGKKSRRL